MNYQDQLDRAGFALRNKVGKVLSSGSEIMTARDRAAGYRGTSNAQVNATAEAVFAKASGLLTQYRSIESESVTVLSQAAALRVKMETDPVWKSVTAGNYESLGWATLARAKDYIGEVTGLLGRLASLAARCDAHLKAVSDLQGDLSSLESFAQGRGFRATAQTALGIGSQYLSVAKFGAIAIAGFFAWDLLKPILTARKVTR